MDYKRLIIFYFKPKGEMTKEELSEKRFAVQSKFYNSLNKSEKGFYWFFRATFMIIILIVLNILLDFLNSVFHFK